MNARNVVLRKALQKVPNVWLDVKHSYRRPNIWLDVNSPYRNHLYPIIKAVDKASAIKCTFSVANGIFVEASKRLMEYFEALPMSKICQCSVPSTWICSAILRFYFTVRQFVEFLKRWQSEYTEFHFSTYQLTILVLWYFQYRNYLPSIRVLQNNSNKIMCGGKITHCLLIMCIGFRVNF